MSAHGSPTPSAPQKTLQWLKVIGTTLGLITTTGGLIAGVVYGNVEKRQNDDLTKQLNELNQKQADWEAKEAAWEQKWGASQDQIQKLHEQLLDTKQQDISCKSIGESSEQLQKSFDACQASLSSLKKADNEGILKYIDNLNDQLMSVENEIYRLQESRPDGSVNPGNAYYLDDYKAEQAKLQQRIEDAQKRLICPG
jgi:chromosome segregation ATPase